MIPTLVILVEVMAAVGVAIDLRAQPGSHKGRPKSCAPEFPSRFGRPSPLNDEPWRFTPDARPRPKNGDSGGKG